MAVNGSNDSSFEENGRLSKYAESNESDDQQTDNNTDDEDYQHSSDNQANNNGMSSNDEDNNNGVNDSETDQDDQNDDEEDMDYELEKKPNVDDLNSKIKHNDKHHDKHHQSSSNNDTSSSHHNSSNNNSVRVKKEKKRISYKEEDSDYDSEYESRPKKKMKKAAQSDDEDDDYSEEEYSSSSKKKKSKESSSKKDKKKSKKEKEKEKESSKSSKSKSKDKEKKKKDKDKKDKKKSKSKVEEVKVELKSPSKGKKKKEENTEHIWKWWEEIGNQDASIKWKTLSHNGPVFAPPYDPLPSNVKFYYDGKVMKLEPRAEEIATFYGRMIDHDYTSKKQFNDNFFHDWKKYMTAEEREKITDLKKCNFVEIDKYFKEQSELRKQRTKEEKLEAKAKEEEIRAKYGWSIVDGHKQQIGNYKIEPPGLFRGRGEHPKMGKVKCRIEASDVIINIGKEATVPEPPRGQRWKEVRHDNTVTWLASWTENIMGSVKYIMLNPTSKLKSQKDWQKYEKARELKKCVKKIRKDYEADFKAKEMVKRQRAVALYFIDKLALRAGNERKKVKLQIQLVVVLCVMSILSYTMRRMARSMLLISIF